MITNYQSPTSKNDQRLDIFSSSSSSFSDKFLKPSVPKIPSSEMDRIPRDYLERNDEMNQEERERVFLRNSTKNTMPLQMHVSKEPNLGKSVIDNPSLLIGSILGLVIMYRVLQNYT
jgi:hypothetical protein